MLFLWVTSPLLFECQPVITAWGFTYRASIVWNKNAHSMGHYVSVQHEFLLICTRGSATPDSTKRLPSVVTEQRGRHSEKPEVFRGMIDEMYTNGKRIELFARSVGFQGQLINSPGLYKGIFEFIRNSSHLGKFVVTRINQTRFRDILFSKKIGFVPHSSNSKSLVSGSLHELAQVSLASVAGLDEAVRERGGELLVFLIPNAFSVGDYSYFPANLDISDVETVRRTRPLQNVVLDWCREHRVACLDPIEAFQRLERSGQRLYFATDAHWTAAGHAAAAQLIRAHPLVERLNGP